jgi:hypothetical protein
MHSRKKVISILGSVHSLILVVGLSTLAYASQDGLFLSIFQAQRIRKQPLLLLLEKS